jgi:hypothetical protein
MQTTKRKRVDEYGQEPPVLIKLTFSQETALSSEILMSQQSEELPEHKH